MQVIVDKLHSHVPVTVLRIHGDLDGSNYQDLIAKAREVCAAGARHLLLDMSNMPYMSSAGLVALHSVAVLARGEEPSSPEHGWAAFHAVSRDSSGKQTRVKLLNPQPRVDRTLQTTGMREFFEVFTDLPTALDSFKAE